MLLLPSTVRDPGFPEAVTGKCGDLKQRDPEAGGLCGSPVHEGTSRKPNPSSLKEASREEKDPRTRGPACNTQLLLRLPNVAPNLLGPEVQGTLGRSTMTGPPDSFFQTANRHKQTLSAVTLQNPFAHQSREHASLGQAWAPPGCACGIASLCPGTRF